MPCKLPNKTPRRKDGLEFWIELYIVVLCSYTWPHLILYTKWRSLSGSAYKEVQMISHVFTTVNYPKSTLEIQCNTIMKRAWNLVALWAFRGETHIRMLTYGWTNVYHRFTSLLLRRFITGSKISSVLVLLQPSFSEANVKTVKAKAS